MSKRSFKEKVCWIVGASSGIGESLAKELNRQGAICIISARHEENLRTVKSQCFNPDNVKILKCDVEETDALPAIAEAAWRLHGNIDYVFLNAGMAVRDLIVNTQTPMIVKSMNTNFLGAAVIARTLLPHMIAQGTGHFVVTSSISGKYGFPKLSAYAASKHALHGFFESLRAEHDKDGIRVIMVIPGLVKTGISLHGLKGDGSSYGKMQESLKTGLSPEVCALRILKGVLKNKNEVIVGGDERFTILLNRLFPSLMAFIIRNHPMQKLKALRLKKATQS